MAIDPADIVPTLEQIGSKIKSFTRDSDGNTLGTFTEDTSPTADAAEREALSAARYVTGEIGSPSVEWTEELFEQARDVVAARAALMIATGEYGDESAPDDARLDQLGRIAREELKALVKASRDNRPGDRRFHSIKQRNRDVA